MNILKLTSKRLMFVFGVRRRMIYNFILSAQKGGVEFPCRSGIPKMLCSEIITVTLF